MAGYTRQSRPDITNGADVTAPPLNAEFDQVETAFGVGGHSHDGTAGNAPKINLATSVSGFLPSSNGGIGGKNNVTATSNPTITDDTGAGYAVGSVWINTSTDRAFICLSNTSSAAVWHEFVAITGANTIVPVATNTVDLGTTANRFKDLVLSGNATIATNATIGGTLGVTGNTTLSGTLGVTGTLTASGNATVGGTLGVTGNTTVSNLTVSGTNTIASADINSGAMDNTVIGSSTPAAATVTTLNVNTSLVAATADINGGTVDAATIGASTAAAGTFTNLTSTGTSTHATVDINGGAMDGTTIGASNAAAASFTTVSTSGQATLATVDINGGTIDGVTIGGSSTGAITGTTITGTSLVGPLTGNVTGNLTGNITGNATGNLTGNVTASSGTSVFNNVTVNGTLDVTGTTIANVTDPSSAQDAATKNYVDTEVAALVSSAPGTLDTLNELAAALNDDPNFSTTITNSIATKLPLAGGTMSGAIAMGTSKITGLGDPTANQDAATKKYTTDTFLPLAGGTVTGAIDVGSNKITASYTPSANTDLTTKLYVDNIAGSGTAASASATAAASSATASATSATNSANSATASASSATSSAASLATFQSQYHGSQSSAPTQDPDGSSLDLGDLYFDSTTDIMKVYGSGGWANAGSSVNGTSSRQTYTATAGQTVFAVTYDSGFVDVYLNGVKLLAGTDFTATNGSNITLASGAAANDVVDIVAYGTFSLSTHYTKTEADALLAAKLPLSGGTLTGGLTGTTATFTGLVVDDITIDGSTISDGGDFTLDVGGNIIIDSDGGNVLFKDGGTDYGQIASDSNTKFLFYSAISDGDMIFQGNDGGSTVTALTLDMSDAGTAIFNNLIKVGGTTLTGASLTETGTFTISGGTNVVLDAANEVHLDADSGIVRIRDAGGDIGMLRNESNDFTIRSMVGDADLLFKGNDGGSVITALTLDMSESGNATFNNNVVAGNSVGVSGSAGMPVLQQAAGSASFPSYSFFDDGNTGMFRPSADALAFATGGSERFRIDSSGRLLHGKTSTAFSVAGHRLDADGNVEHIRDGNPPLNLNRKSSDGSIAVFYKDGTTVGSIGTEGGAIQFGQGNVNLKLNNAIDAVTPSNGSGTNNDNAIDLGHSVARFKDLYLSGSAKIDTSVILRDSGNDIGLVGGTGGNDFKITGTVANIAGIQFAHSKAMPMRSGSLADNVSDLGSTSFRWDDVHATNGTIQTSDRNEKQDIAELTDAEQRVAVAAKGLLRKFRWKDKVAEKGDEARTHFGIIAQDLQAAFAAEGLDAGDYAMFISSTWTDEETGEERTRMGVRYSELLAFIIAAI